MAERLEGEPAPRWPLFVLVACALGFVLLAWHDPTTWLLHVRAELLRELAAPFGQ